MSSEMWNALEQTINILLLIVGPIILFLAIFVRRNRESTAFDVAATPFFMAAALVFCWGSWLAWAFRDGWKPGSGTVGAAALARVFPTLLPIAAVSAALYALGRAVESLKDFWKGRG